MADASGLAALLTQAPAIAALVAVLGVVVGVCSKLVLSADRRADAITKAADDRVTEMRDQVDRLQGLYDAERELRRRGEDRVSELTREVHGLKLEIKSLSARVAGGVG